MITENEEFLSKQIPTYLGNKRNLLNNIDEATSIVKKDLGKDKLKIIDCFSGSGIVSRFFKQHSSLIISNDIEDYSSMLSKCYLTNPDEINSELLEREINYINNRVNHQSGFFKGFIEEMYSPADDNSILLGERAFYTNENAKRIDRYRQLIEATSDEIKPLLLGPLLVKASIHTNTSGVFKGFYKNSQTGIGKFGGNGAHSLNRITKQIILEKPLLSNYSVPFKVMQEDALEAAKQVSNLDLDLAYLDPPYNQHPYGSNYFMLNLITNYSAPSSVSKVSGIPKDWKRSEYNTRSKSWESITSLVKELNAKYILISFSNEGFIELPSFQRFLENHGKVSVIQKEHPTFRGSRNLRNRNLTVIENMFLLKK